MDLSVYKQRMWKSVDHLALQLSWLQVGRATTALVDHISVTVSYGSLKINQLANVVVLDNQTLKIEPWDKSTVWAIERAVYDAQTWLTPQNEWWYLLIRVPSLTHERREEISKQVNKLWEESKIALRQVRHDALKDISQLHESKELSDDAKKGEEKKIDEMIKQMTWKIDDLVDTKTHEVLSLL